VAHWRRSYRAYNRLTGERGRPHPPDEGSLIAEVGNAVSLAARLQSRRPPGDTSSTIALYPKGAWHKSCSLLVNSPNTVVTKPGVR